MRSLTLVMFLVAMMATAVPVAEEEAASAATEAPPPATRHEHGRTAEAGPVEVAAETEDVIEVNCKSALLPGQFLCTGLLVDVETQQPRACNRDTGKAYNSTMCTAAPGFVCKETGNR